MAEPPAVTPSAVAAAEQDGLLATKLHVPARSRGLWTGRDWWRSSIRDWRGADPGLCARGVRQDGTAGRL